MDLADRRHIAFDLVRAGLGVPILQFNDVKMNIGSVLGDIVAPIAERAEEIFEPMQPIFDLLEEPIPGVSDLSEKIGGDQVNLLFMSKALSALPNPPTELLNVINSVDRLRDMAELAQHLASFGNTWVTIGSFNISGSGGNPLLSEAAAARGICISTNGRPWSSTATVSISPG